MRVILFAFSLLLLLQFPAQAQDVGALLNRIERMERDMQNLQMEVFRGDGARDGNEAASTSSTPAPQNASRIEARLSALEDNLRELTGKIEEVKFASSQSQKQQERFASDAELRFQTLEAKLLQLASTPAPTDPAATQPQPPHDLANQPIVPPQSGQAQPIEPSATPSAPAIEGNAVEIYEKSLALLQQANYVGAENGFKQFLQSFADHRLAPNAQYWLAETFYVRAQFTEAAVEFLKSYQNFPKANKAPDSLLKLGLSLAQLNNKAEACTTFAKLQKEYPRATPPVRQRAQTEITKLQCVI